MPKVSKVEEKRKLTSARKKEALEYINILVFFSFGCLTVESTKINEKV